MAYLQGLEEIEGSLGLELAVRGEELHQSIKQYARAEEEMTRRLEELSAEDNRIRAFLDHMLQDERRHHSALQRLSNLVDRDTAAYDEYLDLFHKYMVSPP